MSQKLNTATQRLRQDYLRLARDPVPYVTAHPQPSNILEWHYVVHGPEGTPYEGGVYHGRLEFPKEFPFKPPSIYMITPNGRFKCNTRLCLSISDFHPDTWNPAWSVATILTGLLSFMVEDQSTLGSIETTDREKRQLAKDSLEYNLRNPTFCELFPRLAEELKGIIAERKRAEEEALRLAEANQSAISARTMPPQPDQSGLSAIINSTLTNVVVIVGFAAFVYVVKYVLTLSAETAAGTSQNF